LLQTFSLEIVRGTCFVVTAELRAKTIFITGTDTGVGKTVLTALLLSHLRQTGVHALAIKPFCSGGRGDAHLLHSLQNDDPTLDQINPFYFPEPLAPLVAARKHNQQIPIDDVLRHIRSIRSHVLAIENRKSKLENPTLLIEGAGGLLAPLGESKSHSQFQVQSSVFKVQRSKCFTALDLINAINCSVVIIVAPNRLGTINHTMLTVGRLQDAGVKRISVVLIDLAPKERLTSAAKSNRKVLAESLHPLPVFLLPYLGSDLADAARFQAIAKARRVLLGSIVSSLCG
jgi:dethiobiotin synthetase